MKRVGRISLTICVSVMMAFSSEAGLVDAVSSSCRFVAGLVSGCMWGYPNRRSHCGRNTVGDSFYCKDHKCARCKEKQVGNCGYCAAHVPRATCIWPSCDKPGEFYYRHRGVLRFVNGEPLHAAEGKYCKAHFNAIVEKLIAHGHTEFDPQVRAHFEETERQGARAE